MKPNKIFANRPKSFWAAVRSISQQIGYSKGNVIIAPSIERIASAFDELGLDSSTIYKDDKPTDLAKDLHFYLAERARILKEKVEPKLLSAAQAKDLFEKIHSEGNYTCPIPLNKQKGEKKAAAFLTGIVNMMIERNSNGLPCNYDPRALTTITRDDAPLRTLARRVDGAFPSTINPIAIWEIKEYYYTTTFGSRVADGVYETLLDGLEIEELREHEGVEVKHYLMVDAHYTWWECGKAYLCRIFDMLHMGYVDEVLFGQEVVDEMPRIVSEWINIYHCRKNRAINIK